MQVGNFNQSNMTPIGQPEVSTGNAHHTESAPETTIPNASHAPASEGAAPAEMQEHASHHMELPGDEQDHQSAVGGAAHIVDFTHLAGGSANARFNLGTGKFESAEPAPPRQQQVYWNPETAEFEEEDISNRIAVHDPGHQYNAEQLTTPEQEHIPESSEHAKPSEAPKYIFDPQSGNMIPNPGLGQKSAEEKH